MSTLAEDLRVLALKKRAAESAEDIAKKVKADAKAFEQQCYDRIEQELGTDETGGASIRNTFGTFVAGETVMGYIQDEDAFVEWARAQDETYFEDKPRKALINQLVRECLDNNEPLPPGLGAYGQRRVSVRGR